MNHVHVTVPTSLEWLEEPVVLDLCLLLTFKSMVKNTLCA